MQCSEQRGPVPLPPMCLGEIQEQIAPQDAVVSGSERAKRAVKPARRVLVCELLKCTLACAAAPVDGAAVGVQRRSLEEVVCDLCDGLRVGSVLAFQRLCDPKVQPGAAGGSERSVQHAVNQGMCKDVPARRGSFDDGARTHGLLDVIEHIVLRTAHCLEHVEAEVFADHGRERHQAKGLLREPPETTLDYFAHAIGKSGSGDTLSSVLAAHVSQRTCLCEMPNQLADEVRIAVGVGGNSVNKIIGCAPGGASLDKRADVTA